MFAMYQAVKRIPEFTEKNTCRCWLLYCMDSIFSNFRDGRFFWQQDFPYTPRFLYFLYYWLIILNKEETCGKTSVWLGLTIFFFNGAGSPRFSVRYPDGVTLAVSTHIWIFRCVWSILLSVLFSWYWLGNSLFSFIFLLVCRIFIIRWLHMRKLWLPEEESVQGVGWTDEVSRNASIINLIRLQGFDFFEKTSRYDFVLPYLTNPILLVISFIWPVLSSELYFLLMKKKKNYISYHHSCAGCDSFYCWKPWAI